MSVCACVCVDVGTWGLRCVLPHIKCCDQCAKKGTFENPVVCFPDAALATTMMVMLTVMRMMWSVVGAKGEAAEHQGTGSVAPHR